MIHISIFAPGNLYPLHTLEMNEDHSSENQWRMFAQGIKSSSPAHGSDAEAVRHMGKLYGERGGF